MILSKAPLRVSFFGGGSDIPTHYLQWGGSTISTAINKYIYVAVMYTPNNHIKISYSKQELVTDVEDIQNEIVRNVLKYFNITSNIEITSFADIPTIGTGLGGSSAFTCALLRAITAYVGLEDMYNEYDIAELACKIEIDMCGWKIGKQDQYASAFGGMNYIQYSNSDRVHVHKMNPTFIENHMTLIPTHIDRHSSKILDQINFNDLDKTYVIRELSHMADMYWKQVMTAKECGSLLNNAWTLKKQMQENISNDVIDEMYLKCLEHGAYGAKLLGAGGGGYMLALCPTYSIEEAFSDRVCLDVGVSHDGARVVYKD